MLEDRKKSEGAASAGPDVNIELADEPAPAEAAADAPADASEPAPSEPATDMDVVDSRPMSPEPVPLPADAEAPPAQ